MFEIFLYIIVPYLCLAVMIVGLIINIKFAKLKISAPATGFFEKKKLFWGSTPWHYGILVVLFGHLIGLLFPDFVQRLLSNYSIRVFLEIIALGVGFSALFGAIVLLIRRTIEKSVANNTQFLDIFVLIMLIIQVVLGVVIAINYRWGMNWYASNISKYLFSIFTFTPKLNYVSGMPIIVGLHIFVAFFLLAFLPFTRLIHLVFIPVGFLFRKPQLIIYHNKN